MMFKATLRKFRIIDIQRMIATVKYYLTVALHDDLQSKNSVVKSDLTTDLITLTLNHRRREDQ